MDPGVLQAMAELQRHRGPDDQGFRLFSLDRAESVELTPGAEASSEPFEAGVGFNRLSILDLSDHGHQPMSTPDGRVFIAFNGEVYNAFDYRAELEADGVRLRSRTDTEILLHLYRKYGFEGMLARANGMFAICLVDLDRRELFLARDRLGIKPLYLAEQDGQLLFSSEVKSFLAVPEFSAEIDSERLDEYLMFRYCAGEGFLLRNVRQLAPGAWLRIGPDGRRGGRYWSVPDGAKVRRTEAEAVEAFEGHLRASVKRRLLSDVKIGCQLSGGIDSTLTSVFARADLGADMDTFSVVFDDPRVSEDPWIRQASDYVDAVSHRYTFTADYFAEHLDRATWHLDQPLNHPNSVAIYFLAENARDHVTVFLSGEGADELLGGYTRYYFGLLRPFVRAGIPFLARVPRFGDRFATAFGSARTDPVDWLIAATAYQSPSAIRALRPEARIEHVMSKRRAVFEQGSGSYLSRSLRYDLSTYLVDLLVRQDKMTMAHSMENRVPFLDHELVEFARTLEDDLLVRRRLSPRQTRMRNTKVLLKKMAARHFDADFVYRKKAAFVIPVTDYFSAGSFVSVMEERVLPGIRRRGWLEAGGVESWWNALRAGAGADRVESMWIAVALEIWAQQFMDR